MNNLIIKDLTIRYGSFTPVAGISFDCVKGQFVSLVGKSGTGKSSILNAVANFIPFDGSIDVEGRLGYIFQSFSLYPWMTCRQNIQFGIDGASSKEKKIRADELLEKIDMIEHADKYPAQLSGGQAQRIAIARSLAVNPDILLADEPFAALDFFTRDKMHEWFLHVLETMNLTVLFVTHYIEEAIFLSDRILVLKDAALVGEVLIPFPRPRSPDIKFSSSFMDLKKAVFELM